MKFWQGFFSVFTGFDSYEVGREYGLFAVFMPMVIAVLGMGWFLVSAARKGKI